MQRQAAFSPLAVASPPEPVAGSDLRLAQAVVDGLSAHIAVVDQDGVIRMVNRAWRSFAAANGGQPAAVLEGANYLAVCDAAAATEPAARACAVALRAVLAGDSEYAELEYPCHAPHEQRWFIARITRLPGQEPGQNPTQAIIAHETITQRVLAEHALAASEQALRRSQEIAHIGHWTWDTRANVVTWSDEMKRIFGLDPAQFAGNLDAVIQQSIHPEDAPRVIELNAQVVREGRPQTMDYRIIRPDGDIRTVRATPADRVLDEQGHVVLLSGVVQDISAQKQYERALIESEARHRALFENNHTVMLLIDPRDGALLDANQAASEYYGWTRAELRTMRIFQINTLPRHLLERVIEQALGRQRNHFVFQHRRADGSVRDVEVFNGPVLRQDRTILYSIVHDITERKRAEEALRQSEVSLAQAQQIAGLGSWDYDVITRWSTWSDELYRLLGADPQQERLTLPCFWELLHPDDHVCAQQAHDTVLQTGGPLQLELRSHPQRGPLCYFICHLQAVPDAQGQVRKVVGTLLDITERKQAALTSQALADQLTQVMRSVPEGVILLGPQGELVLANPQAEAWLARLGTLQPCPSGRRLAAIGAWPLRALLAATPAGTWCTVEQGGVAVQISARPVDEGPAAGGWVLVLRDLQEKGILALTALPDEVVA